MPSTNQLFLSIFLPAIVCGGLYILVFYIRRNKEKTEHLLWLTAATLSIGYIIGYIGIEGRIVLIPRESIHWFIYLAVFALLSSTYWDSVGLRRTISQVIYSILIPRILLDALFQHTWGTVQGIIWWICLSISIFVFWHIVKQSFSAIPSYNSVPIIYFVISGGTSLVIALTGSIRLALHAGTLVAIFISVWILNIILQNIHKKDSDNSLVFPQSVSPLLTFLFVGIWMNGYFYGEAPFISILLLAISPLLIWIHKIKALQPLINYKPRLIQVGLITLFVGVAVGIAVIRSGLFGQETYY